MTDSAPDNPIGVPWLERWGLLACVVLAVFLRVVVLWVHANELTRDRDAYLGIAKGLVEGRGYVVPESHEPTAFRPPLYPVLLAGMMFVVPAASAVALLNLFWCGVTVAAVWEAGKWLGLRWGSLVAAFLVAIDPMLLQLTAQPMTEVTCAGLVALLVLWSVRRDIRENWRQFGIGLLFGALVLCRPTFWPLAGLALVVWIGSRATDRRVDSQAKTPIFPWRIVVATLLVVAPWVIRNQLVMGSPILTTTHGGYTLLLANNPVFYADVVDRGWGSEWTKPSFDRWQEELQGDLKQLGEHATELDRDRWQSLQARRFISESPSRFLKAVVYRIRSLWAIMPQGDAAAAIGPRLVQLIGLYYAAELLAFATGIVVVGFRMARSTDARRTWWPLLALIITVQAVHLAYWTNARMRAPILPVISLLAVAAICRPEFQSSRSADATQ